MLPLDPQGINYRAHQARSVDSCSRPGASHAPVAPLADVSDSTTPRPDPGRGRGRALSSDFVNKHQTETTSSPHLPTTVLTSSASTSLLPVRLPAPTGPLPHTPPVAALKLPPLARRHDSGLHVEPSSPKLHSPLRYFLNYFDDNTDPIDSLINTPPAGHPRNSVPDMAYTGDNKAVRPRVITTRTEDTSATPPPTMPDNSSRSRLSAWISRTNTSTSPPTTNSTSKPTSPAGLSQFNFFGSTPATQTSIASQDDELMTLDIEKCLFPGGGPPADETAFSPAAFNNLEMNATGLLDKFQTAYQQRVIEFQDLKTDRDSLQAEKSQAERRMKYMEKQLEEHARKADERDAFIESLLKKLALGVSKRPDDVVGGSKEVSPSRASTISEDLDVDEDWQRGHWRKSTSTSKSEETDEESMDEASVFSRSRSPTISTSLFELSPVATPTQQSKPIMLEPPKPLAARTGAPQMTAFQKLFKGIGNEKARNTGAGPRSCSNCQGQDSSMAWDTVDLLKGENKGLKLRVEELETAVESALDVVNGLVL